MALAAGLCRRYWSDGMRNGSGLAGLAGAAATVLETFSCADVGLTVLPAQKPRRAALVTRPSEQVMDVLRLLIEDTPSEKGMTKKMPGRAEAPERIKAPSSALADTLSVAGMAIFL